MADIKTAAIRAICHAIDESESDVIAELARLDSDQLGKLARAADLVSGVASVELSNREE
jgi:hypothetical protein